VDYNPLQGRLALISSLMFRKSRSLEDIIFQYIDGFFISFTFLSFLSSSQETDRALVEFFPFAMLLNISSSELDSLSVKVAKEKVNFIKKNLKERNQETGPSQRQRLKMKGRDRKGNWLQIVKVAEEKVKVANEKVILLFCLFLSSLTFVFDSVMFLDFFLLDFSL
jgi:hypothetical protein